MKKFRKIAVSLLLLVAISVSFASCDILPFDFTNDDPLNLSSRSAEIRKRYANTEIYWLDTIEEALTAIEHLEAAGNKITKNIISTYENEYVDAKYHFIFTRSNSNKLKKGQMWYDREGLNNVHITYIAFMEDVTIDDPLPIVDYEIQYKSLRLYTEKKNLPDSLSEIEMVFRCPGIYDDSPYYQTDEIYYVDENGRQKTFVGITYRTGGDHNEVLPENFHEEFLKTLLYVGE